MLPVPVPSSSWTRLGMRGRVVMASALAVMALHGDTAVTPAAATEPELTAAPLFSADFNRPLDVQTEASLLGPDGKRVTMPTSQWVLESQGGVSQAYTRGGALHIENHGGHCVLWLNHAFPANVNLSFGVRPINISGGLNIVFVSAAPPTVTPTGSIFDLSLPARGGNYSNYFNGLAVYSDSYFRADGKAGPGLCDRNTTTGLCEANLRKDPGFHLVAHGVDLVSNHVPRGAHGAFEVAVVRRGGTVEVTVDGRTSVRWTDPNPLAGGFVGLRQMLNTNASTYTHLDVVSEGLMPEPLV
eukprot:m.214529 g.214529  ORF g.214529 m.214529 type:complete len:299 (+) comp27211_c0_seq1:59-955(+)